MKHWIGIDVSSKKLDFALLDGKGAHLESVQTGNDRKAVMKLMASWRKKHGVDPAQSLICLEPTGHYTLMMLNLVVEQDWKTWLAHPLNIQKCMGIKRVKNDKVDALQIAEYARTFEKDIRLFTADHLKLDKLQHLLARRQHLVRTRAKHKTHITDLNRYMDQDIQREFDRMDKQQIKQLDKLIGRVDELIDAQIKKDPVTKEQYELLQTIPGVGAQLAAYLITITDGFVRFTDPRELACHAGVAPFERSSGSSVRGRTQVSHQANKTLKSMLHMAAMCHTRVQGQLNTYYKRKVAEGKKPMSVLNALRNKILHIACAVIRDKKPYELKVATVN